MNLLLFSTLYPNANQPHHGIFVENRLRQLLAYTGWRAHVVAPVPYFPNIGWRPRAYAPFIDMPRREQRHGVSVEHPRFAVIPKIGMSVTPALLYLSARRTVAQLMRQGHRFDLIDAHYVFPDGVAAGLLAREFKLPYTITGRGTDLNLIPRFAVPRRQIQWTAKRADALITVCDALAEDLADLGIARQRVTVLRNGVDLTAFRRDEAARAALRQTWSADNQPVYLSVGHLIDRKGHDLVIEALVGLPGHLVIAGTGPEESALRRLAARLGVAERVHFLGALPHEQLYQVYSAADLLILASSREGWPNVLLESLACGTPVVATAVNGSPEVVREAVAGEVVEDRTAAALCAAAGRVLARRADPAAVRAYAEAYSWDATSQGQQQLFTAIVGQRRPDQRSSRGTDPLGHP
ncbi:MAG: glycosyltransferase family 4 protein [Rhodothalassiaceae bacterium]